MNRAIEQKIKDKLRNISKETGLSFNSLLNNLFLERFLVRVSCSLHKDTLIFKGGLCLSKLINLGRATRDLDFLAKGMQGSITSIKSTMEDICNVVNDDGFAFTGVNVNLLQIEHKKYPGYNVKIVGHCGQIRQCISLDVGVGDVVRPRLLKIDLMQGKEPVFEKNISLNSYPVEYIFSEKLEAVIYLGDQNSRMKDFFDLHTLITKGQIDPIELKSAIAATFNNRETVFELIRPEWTALFENKWKAFLKKNSLTAPGISKIVDDINHFISSIQT